MVNLYLNCGSLVQEGVGKKEISMLPRDRSCDILYKVADPLSFRATGGIVQEVDQQMLMAEC